MARKSKFTFSEAITIKARARRLTRDLEALLAVKDVPTALRKQIESLRGELKRTWADLEHEAKVSGQASEADVYKTVAGKQYPAGDFLVVEDPELPTTWHLQVRRNGTPDHRLMGAAWAALHGGYRGNKYEGPGKTRAISALKKIYDDEGMAQPAGEAEPEPLPEFVESDFLRDLEECENGYGMGGGEQVPWGVTSFEQLHSIRAAQSVVEEIGHITMAYQAMLNNILYQQAEPADKVAQMQTLTDEFVLMLESVTLYPEEGEGSPLSMPEVDSEVDAEPVPSEQLQEQWEPAVSLGEAEPPANGDRSPLEVNLRLIQPGWGNSRDNHFYPAEMLRRDAHVFEGVKMYATDHRPEEKSVRSEVSVIRNISGFTDDGAPIARVVIFDPSFAEQVRNRAAANVLGTLECSILADGKARSGFEEGGRKGKVVEQITSAQSVDWVTRAGAGGKVLTLVESEEGTQGSTTGEDEGEAAAAGSGTVESSVEVATDGEQPAAAETLQEEAVQEEEPGASLLDKQLVRDKLGKVRSLAPATLLELAFRGWQSEEELDRAIASEVARVREATLSGKPFALGENVQASVPMDAAKIAENVDRVNLKYLGGRK